MIIEPASQDHINDIDGAHKPLQEECSPVFDGIESLRRKFFVGPGDDAIFRKWGEIAIELSLNWLKNPEKQKIHADITLPELAKLFSDPQLPEKGQKIEAVFQECQANILDNSVRVNNPRYIGHMGTVVPWFAVVVDILVTSINQNQVKIETALASSFVERQVLAWMHQLIYQCDHDFYKDIIQNESIALGNITSGGTMGNLTALAVAREHALPGTHKNGFFHALRDSGYRDVAILGSQRVHYSIRKSAAILGLGANSVIMIPVDQKNKIRLDLLEEKILELRERKVLILAIVGIAGTTETGNIDPLEEMALIAQKEKIWFHVDAAWGGAILLSKEHKFKLKGIKLADSVVLDGHKLFYLPMSNSLVLFKDPKSLDSWRHNANYIIRKGSVDLGQTSLEGSRRFDVLKLWFSLKMLGKEGYDLLIIKAILLTEQLKRLVDLDEDFERTSDPEICILTYRFVPKSIQDKIKAALTVKDQKYLEEINIRLNDINVELQKRQREYGESFLSRTTLESTQYSQEIVVLRAVLTNLLTRAEYLVEILQEQKKIGNDIIQEL
ncbi:MAG: aspartate aminotransferase family protein [Deltaproteobacteria bacterium]|nr:aspartate aminotransferase family protein [Deltaproteobacteria bacterium]